MRESGDADQIKPAMEEFSKKTYDVFGKVYQQAQQAAQQQAGNAAGGDGAHVNDDGTVDAQFTE